MIVPSLTLGWLPLAIAALVLYWTGFDSVAIAAALGLLSVAILYFALSSLKRGSDRIDAAIDQSEVTHWLAGSRIRIYIDTAGRLWFRASDIAALIPQDVSSERFVRRYPKGYSRVNPAVDALYLTRETLSAIAARDYAATTSRLMAAIDREIVGVHRNLPAKSDTAKPVHTRPSTTKANWLLRHWHGQLGLMTSLFGSGSGVAGLALLLHLINGPEDITVHYRLAAVQYLLFAIGTAVVLYWWGRGVIHAAQRWIAADRSILVALFPMVLGMGAVGIAASHVIDRERQYLLTEFLTIVRDADSKATVQLLANGHEVVVEGRMGFGTTNRVRALLVENPQVSLVSLTSPGGRAAEGFALMHEIEARKLNTLAWQTCMSACTAAYLGGVQRFATEETQFGFHRSGFRWRKDDGKLSESDHKLVARMRELSIDERFITRSIEPSIHGLYEPNVHEAVAAGIVTEVWR